MVELTATEKVELITRGLQEVLKKNILEDVIVKENRPLKVYWGSSSPLRKNSFPGTRK